MLASRKDMHEEQIKHKIAHKTKPIGALGKLEDLAMQVCKIQDTLSPQLNNPSILVFAADHGIAAAGVSAYPAAVTAQMVLNFLAGGAAINVFCKQHDIALHVVDAGVNYVFPKNSQLIDAKIGLGTKNFVNENALTEKELDRCFEAAEHIVNDIFATGCNVIGFGEMGIGNTSSASMLMSYLCNMPIEECVGRGTGLNEAQLIHKTELLKQAQRRHPAPKDIKEALCCYGGYEIAQICGAMLRAHEKNMLIMVDGFITTVAFLCAYHMNNAIIDQAVFCHQSNEKGHQRILEHLNVKAILDLDMRLGEGTGCAVAYPILKSTVLFMNEMASFESAGVSNNAE